MPGAAAPAAPPWPASKQGCWSLLEAGGQTPLTQLLAVPGGPPKSLMFVESKSVKLRKLGASAHLPLMVSTATRVPVPAASMHPMAAVPVLNMPHSERLPPGAP